MEYKLSEQELKDLMHRSWLKAKNFYSGNTDEYFYDYFESEKKEFTIHSVVVPKGTLCKHTDKHGNDIRKYVAEIDRWYCPNCDELA